MQYKYIHLLYVPTMACNMCCKYCYLEDNTKDEKTKYTALETLKYAVDKFKGIKNNFWYFAAFTIGDDNNVPAKYTIATKIKSPSKNLSGFDSLISAIGIFFRNT